MKVFNLILVICLWTISYSDTIQASQKTCNKDLGRASMNLMFANAEVDRGGQHWVVAYKEIEKKQPDMNIVCNRLDLAGTKFQKSIQFYNLCFKYYKSAARHCTDQDKVKSVKGFNTCDKKGGESAELLKTMNELFVEHCS